MTQIENTTISRTGLHLNWEERNKIHAWKQLEQPLSNRAIAKLLGRAPQTINTEIKDGTVRQIKRQTHHGKTYEYETFVYSPDAGQAAYEKKSSKEFSETAQVAGCTRFHGLCRSSNEEGKTISRCCHWASEETKLVFS